MFMSMDPGSGGNYVEQGYERENSSGPSYPATFLPDRGRRFKALSQLSTSLIFTKTVSK